ncbi:YkgJ family cysteine cluster protein [Galbibacter sp. PAP.153]|uniref:YkgJ family cysteine cluster protein n=1 Tax=Galbibacter sp. PAP.153 TaxID=3104623 RepID=UPI0030091400
MKAIERLFGCLDEEINQFRETTGIFCASGCGKCCNKADIEASPLEFLPLAFYWFLRHEAITKLEQLQNNISPTCIVYSPLSIENITKGSCETYLYRGLICRLFGYAATTDKYGDMRLVTCKLIKENQAENYSKAITLLKQKEYVPIFSDYYKKLMQIDFYLGNQIMPINDALKKALEIVLNYYSYRPFPKFKKAV